MSLGNIFCDIYNIWLKYLRVTFSVVYLILIWKFLCNKKLSESGGCGFTPSLTLLPDPLWPRMVLPVGVPSMGQIDPFENYHY